MAYENVNCYRLMAMRLKDIIAAPKRLIDCGKWSSGKMPKTTFPLSKNRSYTLGVNWHWTVIVFEALDKTFRVRIAFRQDKEQYEALLGCIIKEDTAVLARLEFHAMEPEWHLHGQCGDIDTIVPGILGGNSFRRLKSKKGRGIFGITHTSAMTMASKRFGLFRGSKADNGSLAL